MKKSWDTCRGVLDQEGQELKVVVEQQLSEMLLLQETVKTKICWVESILDLSNRFHHTARQVGPVGPVGPMKELIRYQ